MATADRIAVVTGANTGIGKATVLGLARAGLKVILACRDIDKGEAAASEIRAATGVAADRLVVMALDLASLESVRRFATAYGERFSRLDLLVENAGVSTGKRQLSSDGYELDFAVNHLGHFLLTDLLLPLLRASTPSRIVVVSSAVHKGAKLDFADLQGERKWSAMGAYARSKLANMLFVTALAKRLTGSGVVVNALHPGVIATELARDFPAPLRFLARLLFKSPEQGAKTSLHLALAPELATVSGRYFADSKEAKADPAALDAQAAEQLWQVSQQLIAVAAGRGAAAS